MRLGRTLTLIVGAALCTLVLLGAGSASATVLCSAEPEEKGGDLFCKSGTKLSKAEIVGENEGNLVVETSLGKSECTESTFKATLEEKAGSPPKVTGSITEVTIGGCIIEREPCNELVAFEPKTPFGFEIVYTSKALITGTVQSPTTVIKLKCGGFGVVTCEYGAEDKVEGQFSNAKQNFTSTEQTLHRSGGSVLCPSEATETVTYHVERKGGGAIYVAKE